MEPLENAVKDEKFKQYTKERIERNIFINEKGCWLWTKSKHAYGYGKTTFHYEGKNYHINTHRLAWAVYNGSIPKGAIICHNCPEKDEPSCCNPKHLFLGTHKDNTRDMMKKDRDAFDFIGEKNNIAILTEKKVLEMRKLRRSGMKIKDIAVYFDIKYFTCLDAVSGRNWSHI